MLQGVVFDLDGTLLDTEKLYRRFWVEAARQMGYPMGWINAMPGAASRVRMVNAGTITPSWFSRW